VTQIEEGSFWDGFKELNRPMQAGVVGSLGGVALESGGLLMDSLRNLTIGDVPLIHFPDSWVHNCYAGGAIGIVGAGAIFWSGYLWDTWRQNHHTDAEPR
jgi:hypothetical protein